MSDLVLAGALEEVKLVAVNRRGREVRIRVVCGHDLAAQEVLGEPTAAVTLGLHPRARPQCLLP
ncbi:hypothetical protein ABZ345_36350 [Lentzea sp. NPDC005914]|uniref:hypothetical protein n=1 Tax=Lentzea sp. NPDC005914 TaxID=3154572 RepID=UPI0033C213F8